MKEFRKINIIPYKDGHGTINYKIALPKKWLSELGFSIENKQAIVEIDKNKIVIRKVKKNMLLIKEKNVNNADFELEDGTLLFGQDWNGEIYGNGWKDEKNTNIEYKPVYKFEIDRIDLNSLDENSEEWEKAVEIVGFEET